MPLAAPMASLASTDKILGSYPAPEAAPYSPYTDVGIRPDRGQRGQGVALLQRCKIVATRHDGFQQFRAETRFRFPPPPNVFLQRRFPRRLIEHLHCARSVAS